MYATTMSVPRAGSGAVLVEPSPPLLEPPQDGRARRAVRERVHRVLVQDARRQGLRDCPAALRRNLEPISQCIQKVQHEKFKSLLQ